MHDFASVTEPMTVRDISKKAKVSKTFPRKLRYQRPLFTERYPD